MASRKRTPDARRKATKNIRLSVLGNDGTAMAGNDGTTHGTTIGNDDDGTTTGDDNGDTVATLGNNGNTIVTHGTTAGIAGATIDGVAGNGTNAVGTTRGASSAIAIVDLSIDGIDTAAAAAAFGVLAPTAAARNALLTPPTSEMAARTTSRADMGSMGPVGAIGPSTSQIHIFLPASPHALRT